MLKVNSKVRVTGEDFHNGDDSFIGQTGRISQVIKSGWCEGCVVVSFDDEDYDNTIFLQDDVELIPEQ